VDLRIATFALARAGDRGAELSGATRAWQHHRVRLLVYDRTCVRTGGGLSPVWFAGSLLYRTLGRIDAARGVASWHEARAWIDTRREPIDELQYWGHGKWGCAMVARDPLDASRLELLAGLRERLAPDALVWFRTCETFGGQRGHDFARRLAEFLDARVAGHTFVIGYHQSGLHGLSPGVRPDWADDEGLAEGTAADPRRALRSRRGAPRTITCLTGHVPPAWFAIPTP
jgi:hypothetical protein